MSDLKGEALDGALDLAGLSKLGTADEKRARLTEHLESDEVDAEEDPVLPEVESVVTHNDLNPAF